jgi:hypothetical protein
MFRDTYDRYHSSYLLSSNKRMDDRLANNKLAKVDFHLIFLVKKSYKPDGKSINILVAFEAPNTSVYQKPHKFNELECRIETSKLWMEFYLRISEIFCKPSDTIVSIFGGGKVVWGECKKHLLNLLHFVAKHTIF